MLKKLALNYFEAFRKADIAELRALFSDKVCLRDWNVDVQGIESVISENSKIFETLNDISVNVINLYEDSNTVVAELSITANGEPAIKVVDILEFDEQQKLVAIKAYKG
jgi:steroid delta-isomerase